MVVKDRLMREHDNLFLNNNQTTSFNCRRRTPDGYPVCRRLSEASAHTLLRSSAIALEAPVLAAGALTVLSPLAWPTKADRYGAAVYIT